jgi:hypothetical protein
LAHMDESCGIRQKNRNDNVELFVHILSNLQ